MKTESDKERRRSDQKRQRAADMRAMRINSKALVRCPTCGGLVNLPCLGCYIESLKGKK